MHPCQNIPAGFITSSLSAEKNGGGAVSFKASHQPAGRQSISLATPSPLSMLLVPSVSINVDSCQSQKESMWKQQNTQKSHNTPAVAQGSVNDWICWIRTSGLRPVGFMPHPATILFPAPPPAVCSHAHLQSVCVVFMWSIFSSPATGSCAPVCLVSSSERSWRWIPAESSQAAPSPAWCTIKDLEGCPETIRSPLGIRLLFWLTGKDRMKKKKKKNIKVWRVVSQCISLKKFWALWKKEAEDEKSLILCKVQTRFSNVRN